MEKIKRLTYECPACGWTGDIPGKSECYSMTQRIPLIIGEGMKPCPACGKPLSFAYDRYFCRNRDCWIAKWKIKYNDLPDLQI